jgi:RNA polymerase sigma factor (sigma-70 family)
MDDVVAEAFARVLSAIKRGSGPVEAFRPYLLTCVRRIGYDLVRGRETLVLTDEASFPDHGEPFADPAVADLERSMITRAFRSLPERWSAVLWHTEVEQAKPAEVALILGITPNGVAALSYRAREGLRQAYLQMHLSATTPAGCATVTGLLGSHVRGGLSARDARKVNSHLSTCEDCSAARAELASVNSSLRGLLGPVVLGGEAAAYFTHLAQASAPSAAAMTATSMLRSARRVAWHWPTLPVAAAAGIAAIMAPTAALVYPHLVPPAARQPLAPVAKIRSHPGRAPSQAPARLRTRPAPVPSGPASTSPVRSASPSPSVSPSPAPSGSPSPAPTTSVTASPSPTISALATAELAVSVQLAGVLKLAVVTVVSVEVSDPGTAATSGLTASLTVPAGTTVLGLGASAPSWTCSIGGSAPMTCVHGPIAAGGSATVSFRLLVVSLSGCGEPVMSTVTDGSQSATGTSGGRETCGLLGGLLGDSMRLRLPA